MARGGSRASSELSDEKDYKKNLVSHFRELARIDEMPELKGMKAADLKDAARYVSGASEEARSERDGYDADISRAKDIFARNLPYDWTDKRTVASLLPVTLEERRNGLEPSDVLDNEWEDFKQVNPDYDDAWDKDKKYEDENDGEPANLRGNSAVDALFADWAKGFIKERVADFDAEFSRYQDEVNTVEQNALENWINEREKGGEV